MSSQAGVNQKSTHLTYQSSTTQIEEIPKSKSKRISTQQIPLKKIVDKNGRINFFDNTQFPSISTTNSRKPKLTFRLNTAVEKLIQQEINKGKIRISSHQKNYALKTEKQVPEKRMTTEEKIQQKLIQMSKKKHQTIQTLKQLEQQEVSIKKQSVSFRYRKQSNERKSQKKQRSYFSPQQKKTVCKMLKRHRMLQYELKQKTDQMINQYRKASETQRNHYESSLQQFKSLSKSRIQQKRQSLQIEKLQRLKQHEILKKNYEQVKSKRYLYQQMMRKDKQVAMEQMEEFSKKLTEIKGKMKVTLVEELQQHKQKCNELMKSKTINMKASLFSLNPDISNEKKFQQNYFSRLVKVERQIKKEQQQIARKQVYDLKQKVKEFTEHCDNSIRPKIKVTEQSRFIPIERNRSVNSLSHLQQNQKGKQYLLIAKKLKKCETLEDEKVLNMKQFEKIPNPAGKLSYKNYLTDMKRMSEHNPESAKKRFALYLQKHGSISQFNSLHNAVIVAKSIDAKNKRPKNQKLIDAVQNKIELLKIII